MINPTDCLFFHIILKSFVGLSFHPFVFRVIEATLQPRANWGYLKLFTKTVMLQKLDFKTEISSKDRAYYMILIFDVAFCHLGQNSSRERTKKMLVFLASIRRADKNQKPFPIWDPDADEGRQEGWGGGGERTQGGRERKGEVEESLSLLNLTRPFNVSEGKRFKLVPFGSRP